MLMSTALKQHLPKSQNQKYKQRKNLSMLGSNEQITPAKKNYKTLITDVDKLKQKSINTVLACSALKEKYRKKLTSGLDMNIFWFCLKGEYDFINQRLKNRNNHFFSSNLLQSQFDIIEYPNYCNFIDITESKNKIVELIKLKLLK